MLQKEYISTPTMIFSYLTKYFFISNPNQEMLLHKAKQRKCCVHI